MKYLPTLILFFVFMVNAQDSTSQRSNYCSLSPDIVKAFRNRSFSELIGDEGYLNFRSRPGIIVEGQKCSNYEVSNMKCNLCREESADTSRPLRLTSRNKYKVNNSAREKFNRLKCSDKLFNRLARNIDKHPCVQNLYSKINEDIDDFLGMCQSSCPMFFGRSDCMKKCESTDEEREEAKYINQLRPSRYLDIIRVGLPDFSVKGVDIDSAVKACDAKVEEFYTSKNDFSECADLLQEMSKTVLNLNNGMKLICPKSGGSDQRRKQWVDTLNDTINCEADTFGCFNDRLRNRRPYGDYNMGDPRRKILSEFNENCIRFKYGGERLKNCIDSIYYPENSTGTSNNSTASSNISDSMLNNNIDHLSIFEVDCSTVEIEEAQLRQPQKPTNNSNSIL